MSHVSEGQGGARFEKRARLRQRRIASTERSEVIACRALAHCG